MKLSLDLTKLEIIGKGERRKEKEKTSGRAQQQRKK
jgi:hypothetical protein